LGGIAIGGSIEKRVAAVHGGHNRSVSQGQPGEAEPIRDDDTRDIIPVRGVQSPPTIHHASRRPLGLGPVPLLGAGLLAALLLGVVLIVIGAWPVGVALLACATVVAALLLVAVDREPNDPAAQVAAAVAERARSHTRLIAVAARAWSRAAVAVVRFRQRRYRLRWRFRRQLEPLGEAAYRGEEDRVELLRARAREAEEALRQTELGSAAAVEAARAEIERERAPAAPTRALPVHDQSNQDTS
jgi:hypothetical protein